MLIGAHVSPAGGPAKAVERGAEQGAQVIQIFNQNPRAWKPTVYADEQVEAFHEAMASTKVEALLIHAVYLLNPASDEREFRDKTLASLVASLQAGDRLGARAVVLHPGSAKAGDVGKAVRPEDQERHQQDDENFRRADAHVPIRDRSPSVMRATGAVRVGRSPRSCATTSASRRSAGT